MIKKQTKKVSAKKEANDAIKNLSKGKIESINNSIISGNRSEVADFVMRFAASKDFKNMIGLLASIQDNSQFLRKDTEWETLYGVGVIDGQRLLMQSFVEICTRALEGDREFVDNRINPIIIK